MDLLSASTITAVRLPPRVFIRTLGGLAGEVGGASAVWLGNGVSESRLRIMTAYAVFKADQLMHRNALRAVAYGRVAADADDDDLSRMARPFYVVGGFRNMLKRWEMDAALWHKAPLLKLQRHPVWQSDVDALSVAYRAAVLCEQRGDIPQALALLGSVTPLCGGRYLQEFTFFPYDRLDDQAAYWNAFQRQTLLMFARLSLTHNPALLCEQALEAAERGLKFGGASAADYDIAADAAQHCGLPDIAQLYRHKAQRLRHAPS